MQASKNCNELPHCGRAFSMAPHSVHSVPLSLAGWWQGIQGFPRAPAPHPLAGRPHGLVGDSTPEATPAAGWEPPVLSSGSQLPALPAFLSPGLGNLLSAHCASLPPRPPPLASLILALPIFPVSASLSWTSQLASFTYVPPTHLCPCCFVCFSALCHPDFWAPWAAGRGFWKNFTMLWLQLVDISSRRPSV
jgi:hypothetical protein